MNGNEDHDGGDDQHADDDEEKEQCDHGQDDDTPFSHTPPSPLSRFLA